MSILILKKIKKILKKFLEKKKILGRVKENGIS